MYEIAGFVGERKILESQFQDIGSDYIVDLDYAPYALIPFANDLEKLIQKKCQFVLNEFAYAEYPKYLEKIIAQFVISPKETIFAFVAAEFFGGAGADFGYVFDKGQTTIFCDDIAKWPNSNINMALKAIGVPENLQTKRDAFDVVGLGKCRSINDWLNLDEKQ